LALIFFLRHINYKKNQQKKSTFEKASLAARLGVPAPPAIRNIDKLTLFRACGATSPRGRGIRNDNILYFKEQFKIYLKI